ncbi:hypothetical protein [Mailhella sp.]
MDARPGTCLYCGAPLEPSHRVVLYCCEKHRRKAQDARRKRERAEARAARRRAAGLMRDPYARSDLDPYTAEQLFANAPLDAAPIIGPGDREETLAKRAARRGPERRKAKTRPKGRARRKTPRKAKPRQLSLLELPAEKKAESLVKRRGWKKNWLTLC